MAEGRRAEADRAEADRVFQDAREAVDDCFLTATEHDAFQRPGMQPAQEELLRRARKYNDRFLAQRADDPSGRADVAKTRLALGTIHTLYGQYADAVPELQAALDLDDQLGDHLTAARCLRLIAQCHALLGRSADAGEANADALARLEPLLDTDPAARFECGRACAQEGRRLTEAFQNAEAERVFRRGLGGDRRRRRRRPARAARAARLHSGLSLVLKRLDRVAESG